MFAVVTPETIHLSPGAVVRLPGSWQDYRVLAQQLGDRQLPRIKYRLGEILLRLFKKNQLTIYRLQADGYTIESSSRYFPDRNVS